MLQFVAAGALALVLGMPAGIAVTPATAASGLRVAAAAPATTAPPPTTAATTAPPATPKATTPGTGMTTVVAPTADEGFPWATLVIGLLIAAAIAGTVTFALSRRAGGGT